MAEDGRRASEAKTSGPTGSDVDKDGEPVTLASMKAALRRRILSRPPEDGSTTERSTAATTQAATVPPLVVGYAIATASATMVGLGSAGILAASGHVASWWVSPVGALAFLVMAVGLVRSTLGSDR